MENKTKEEKEAKIKAEKKRIKELEEFKRLRKKLGK